MTAPALHSWSFHNYSLAAFLDYAQRRGWTAVELASCHLGDCPADAVRQAQRRGIKVETLGYYVDLVSSSAEARDHATRELIGLVHLCAELGIAKLNGFAGWLQADGLSWRDWHRHGGRMASAEQRAWFIAAFAAVAKEAESTQVQVFVEVHPNTIHDTVTAAGDLVEAVGSRAVGLTLDPANSAAQDARDADPQNLPDRGFPLYFHFKNYRLLGDLVSFDVEAEHGLLDLRSWIHALPEHTTVCIEYPGEGDPFPKIDAARRYYQDILDDVNASL